MRVLIGPTFSKTSSGAMGRHQVITFSDQEGDIVYRYDTASFADIFKQLPQGWEPEAVLFWSPEYQALPVGIEECPYPLAAAVGDWNLGFSALRDMAACFDYLFTDRQGVEVFHRAGYEKVEHALLFGFNPLEHYRMEGVEPVHDISIIGNLNHQVQRERSQWLARVAALSDRYRVGILTGLYGEDYTRAVNQTKITFNRSIRGEMNMRAYEAPACGSLLFYEEENLEVGDVYTDRVHCVLYNENNLEELLEYYLTHEEERVRIVEAAHERVQSFTYELQALRLLDRIEELGIPRIRRPRRSFFALNEAIQRRVRATQAMQSVTPGVLLVAERELRAAASIAPDDATVRNNLGVLYASYAQLLPDPVQRGHFCRQALSYFESAREAAPAHAVAEANRGQVLLALQNPREAEKSVREAIALLKDCPPDWFADSLYFPRAYDAFRVEYERLSASFADDPDAFAGSVRDLFRWRLYETLGDIRAERQAWAPAADAYRQAIAAIPAGSTRYRLARILESLGLIEEAISELEQALRDEPFLFEAYEELARHFFNKGRYMECDEACRKALHLIQSCPAYENRAAGFREWRQKCEGYGKPEGVEDLPVPPASDPNSQEMKTPPFRELDTSSPLFSIEGLKDFNFLYWPLVSWEEARWQEVLQAYTGIFSADDPVTLVINPHGVLSCPDERLEGIAAGMQSFLIEMGRSPALAADILLLDAETASMGPEAIVSGCQALVACGQELVLPDFPIPVIRSLSGDDLPSRWRQFISEHRMNGTVPHASRSAPRRRYSLDPMGAESEATRKSLAFYADFLRDCRRVLDVNCGPGYFLEMLAERSIPAEGIDPDPSMVIHSRQQGFQVFVADARSLDEIAGPYDSIRAGNVIERMAGEQAVKFLEECVRLLSPGGLLILSTADWENPEVRERTFWLDSSHVRPYPLPLLERIFLDLGLDILQTGTEETGSNNLYIIGRKPEE